MTTNNKHDCQLSGVPVMAEPLGRVSILWQLRNRVKRITKRRMVYLTNLSRSLISPREKAEVAVARPATAGPLQPGDLVRVRSKAEIQSTLSNWNQMKGCAMMEEMWDYCGTRQRVFKRVERFLDERDYRMKKTSGIVLLDRVICQGTVDFGPCDRSCFFFWKEEWLEKIAEDGGDKP